MAQSLSPKPNSFTLTYPHFIFSFTSSNKFGKLFYCHRSVAANQKEGKAP